MAEPDTLIHPSKLPAPKTQQDSPTFFSSFLYKAIFVSVFIALLPLFPSQAPEFVNQTILTRSWELLHLLLVGIAISYGLFSRRNANPEMEKETHFKADTPQSYVSRILQVSSVFDEDEDEDEAETPTGYSDESKIQAWNSQYYREEPVVMVAKGRTNGRGNSSSNPLFLPVRSLRSRAQHTELLDSGDEIDGFPVSDDGSGLALNGMDEIGKINDLDSNDERTEAVVLPSPIPWRSRSRRTEVSPPSYSLAPPSINTDLGYSKIPSFRSSAPRSASSTPSPKRLTPSSSLSPELRAKTSEDLGKKKSFYSPPPAPPPPPLPPGHGSHYKRDVKKSLKDELEDFNRRGREEGLLRSNYPSTKSGAQIEGSSVGRSVRTVRSKEVHSSPLPRNQIEKKDEFMEKVIITSDDSDSDDGSEPSDVEEASNSAVEAGPDENEVDKKADEFIAKFREQIRLQRIESIKRSSGQRSARSPK